MMFVIDSLLKLIPKRTFNSLWIIGLLFSSPSILGMDLQCGKTLARIAQLKEILQRKSSQDDPNILGFHGAGFGTLQFLLENGGFKAQQSDGFFYMYPTDRWRSDFELPEGRSEAVFGSYLTFKDAITEAGSHAYQSDYKRLRMPFLQGNMIHSDGLVFAINREALDNYKFAVDHHRVLEVGEERYPLGNYHVITLKTELENALLPFEFVHSFPRSSDRKIVAKVLTQIDRKLSEKPTIPAGPSNDVRIQKATAILRSLRDPSVGVQFSTLNERTGVPVRILRDLVLHGNTVEITEDQISAILQLETK